ncbi:MAG: hypothetical protein IT435_00710 [Phycisphaerales bacterium]|nr:hypothetical protein [Phycisphaerales bacterium]
MPDQIDANLLCESCGYPLGGLESPAGACPECGTPISSSLSSARPGSPWQRKRSLTNWWLTHWGTIRHPKIRFRQLAIEKRGIFSLMLATLPLAGALLVAPWSGTLVGDPARAARAQGPLIQLLAYALVFPTQALLIAAILLSLTAIECRGILFFAKRRGWRLTPIAAWQICAHASAGWVVGAVVPLMAMAILWAAPGGRPSLLDRLLARGGGSGTATYSTGDAALAGIVGGSYVLGLLVFEILVYIGVRQCRFANPPAASPSHKPATDA